MKTARCLSLAGALLAAALGLAGCEAPVPDIPELDGRWRGELSTPGGPLPFGIEFATAADGSLQAWYLNGGERAAVSEVVRQGDRLKLAIPSLGSRIEAQLGSEGLSGQLSLVGRGGTTQLIPFSARPGDWRFFRNPAPARLDVSGRWQVEFSGDKEPAAAVGEFRQDGHRVTGTFLTPTGDYRFLEGEVRDRELYLSTFAGGHVFLFRATEGPGGVLLGDFWSGLGWHESWTAVIDPLAELPDPTTLTRLNESDEALDFSFPDLNGQPVALSDERFAGKVVIITVAGSWCPNCHDEAAFLAPFYAENAGRGLEVVGLMYEHYPGFEEAAAAVSSYRDRFDIRFPLLIAGVSDRRQVVQSLPLLDNLVAFPTTIILDRSHRVRRVHAGFLGPGTGEYYEEWKAAFTAFLDELLAEPPPA